MIRARHTPSREELTAVAELRSALRRFHAATDEITRRHGLTSRRYDLLALLHGSLDGTETATRLAQKLHLSRNTATELISRAERSGLVVRHSDGRDARVKRIAPTSEGRRRFFGALAELAPERRRLLSILEEIAAHTARLSEAAGRSRRHDETSARRRR